MRVIFMGTPEIGVPTLREIVAHGHDVVAVYSQPPRPAGRGHKEQKGAVNRAADELGLPVFTPRNFKDPDDVTAFAEHDADVAIVVAYGLLLPKTILDAPKYGCLNLHGSRLPRWRGAAPIQRAIMAGDRETAVMVMQMDEGLDTGPVALSEPITITPEMNAGELHDRMAILGADLMVRALSALERESLTFTPQPDEGANYAKKIDKAETRIPFAQPATAVHNHIRGLSPFPGAWCEMEIGGDVQRVKILQSEVASGEGIPGRILDDELTIACAEGAIRVLRLQRAGKGPMSADEFLRGSGSLKGQVLTNG
ncbi:MAG: methionyl-tRNA formyltransferase [Hyphomicrobiaceae bacterium]|nr:methionyl-tRNA formyltransferase [Hyphomicrobiaceae bacterium]MCC0022677.1 methionyl-tRNA formyltransferase [Hyphomicrobiaceae bacterium]